MDWIDEIVAEIWLEIGKRLDCPHKPLADLDIGPIIRRHLNTAHPQPAPAPFQVPKVEIKKQSNGRLWAYCNGPVMDFSEGSSAHDMWCAIAHTCEMLREGQDIIATICEPDADVWLNKLNAGPKVKP
jgi:hypothetical protein